MSRTVPWQDGRRAWERLNGWHVRSTHRFDDPTLGETAIGVLGQVQLIRSLLDMAELNAVLVARHHGATWVEIATARGVETEAAIAKWGEIPGPAGG